MFKRSSDSSRRQYYEIYRKDLEAEPIPRSVDSDGEIISYVENKEELWLTVFTFLQVINYIFEDFVKEQGRYEYTFKEIKI